MDYILFLMVTVKEQKANEAFCSLHHVFQVCLKIFFLQDATKGEDSNCPHSYQFCFFFFYKQRFRTYIKCSHKKAQVQFSSVNYLTVFIKKQTLKA